MGKHVQKMLERRSRTAKLHTYQGRCDYWLVEAHYRVHGRTSDGCYGERVVQQARPESKGTIMVYAENSALKMTRGRTALHKTRPWRLQKRSISKNKRRSS